MSDIMIVGVLHDEGRQHASQPKPEVSYTCLGIEIYTQMMGPFSREVFSCYVEEGSTHDPYAIIAQEMKEACTGRITIEARERV